MTLVAGVDGYPHGWIAIVLKDGAYHDALVAPSLDALVEQLAAVEVIGVDIPIGLPVRGPRQADSLARAFVGPRGSSVFPTPPRAVWAAQDLASARETCLRLTGRSVSSQTFALRPRILEADALARVDRRLREVHPEVSFRELAGRLIRTPKTTWAGVRERSDLLEAAGLHLPADLGQAGVAGIDDVLDAGVVAWTAHRIARGTARTLPDPPEQDPRGDLMAIWV